MRPELLEHIRTLSDSHLSQANALQVFARCFQTIYGSSSFVSLERCNDPRSCRIRMIFRADASQDEQINSHINDLLLLQDSQVQALMESGEARVLEKIGASLRETLLHYQLPNASLMALPVFLDGELKRWLLVLGDEAGQFSQVDLDQALLLANLANTYMARIDETEALTEANEWIEREINDIGRLHKMLLPQEDVQLRGTEVASYVSFCDLAGGDYFDVVNFSRIFKQEYPNDRRDVWGLLIADASGHGAAAAVEIAMFDALLRTYLEATDFRPAKTDISPANVLNYTNRYFFTRTLRGSFITAALLSYDPRSRILRYANAGHPPVIMKTPDGTLHELNQNAGIPLGVEQNWQWQNTGIEIEPGTVLVSYTDGLTEATSPDAGRFGSERFKAVIGAVTGSARDYRDALVAAVQKHQDGVRQADDQALVVVRITA